MVLLAAETEQQMFVPSPQNMAGMAPGGPNGPATGYMSPMFQRNAKNPSNPMFSRFKKADFDYDLF